VKILTNDICVVKMLNKHISVIFFLLKSWNFIILLCKKKISEVFKTFKYSCNLWWKK